MGALCSSGVPPSENKAENKSLLNEKQTAGNVHHTGGAGSKKTPVAKIQPISTKNKQTPPSHKNSPIPGFEHLHTDLMKRRSQSGGSELLITQKSFHESGVKIERSRKMADFYTETNKILGRGTYGIVKVGRDKTTNKKVALKAVKRDPLDKSELYDLYSQIGMLRHLEHDHIVSLVDVFETKKETILVMQYLTGGELFDRVIKESTDSRGIQRGLTEKRAARIFKQVLSSLSYLHGKGIAHRDLKPDNLVFADNSPDSCLKLIDFDAAKQLEVEGINDQTMRREWTTTDEYIGTMEFMAPEIWKSQPYNMCVDVWSAGCILYILLSGSRPFMFDQSRDPETLGFSILKTKHAQLFDKNALWQHLGLTDEATDLCKKLLTKNMKNRITSSEALEHPWLSNNVERELPMDQLRMFQYQNKLRNGVQGLLAVLRLIESLDDFVAENNTEMVDTMSTNTVDESEKGECTPVEEDEMDSSEVEKEGEHEEETMGMNTVNSSGAMEATAVQLAC